MATKRRLICTYWLVKRGSKYLSDSGRWRDRVRAGRFEKKWAAMANCVADNETLVCVNVYRCL